MKKPNFFILGAPKCGTTSLAHWLSLHPQIYMSPIKEPNFFNHDFKYRLSLEKYEQLFEGATQDHRAIGEASVWYLYSKTAVENIENYVKNSRFIVCLRNPVDMAYSLHQQSVFSGMEHVKDFETAWRLNADRLEGKSISRWCKAPPRHLAYNSSCALGTQVETLFEKIAKERVLPLFLDNIMQDTRKEYVKIMDFLNVDDDGRQSFPVKNSSKVRKSILLRKISLVSWYIKERIGLYHGFGILTKIEKFNRRNINRKTLSPEFRKELISSFMPEINKLESILKTNLDHWRQ